MYDNIGKIIELTFTDGDIDQILIFPRADCWDRHPDRVRSSKKILKKVNRRVLHMINSLYFSIESQPVYIETTMLYYRNFLEHVWEVIFLKLLDPESVVAVGQFHLIECLSNLLPRFEFQERQGYLYKVYGDRRLMARYITEVLGIFIEQFGSGGMVSAMQYLELKFTTFYDKLQSVRIRRGERFQLPGPGEYVPIKHEPYE